MAAVRTLSALVLLLASLLIPTASADDLSGGAFAERIDKLADRVRSSPVASEGGQTTNADTSIVVRRCAAYPYGDANDEPAGAEVLLADLSRGLRTGLRCLSGLGPAGRLHPYHHGQAQRLLSLLESSFTKTFQCVDDEMFATAVATDPRGLAADDPLYRQLRRVAYPGVVIDTFRLGGLLSRRFDDETYRQFFRLGEDQIYKHRNAKPIRIPNLHRYNDRSALMFHELVHWLGHRHRVGQPDLTRLYETCCFSGSDYISDSSLNERYQASACRILQDRELWDPGVSNYRRMRVWHLKKYDGLKRQMRADYDH